MSDLAIIDRRPDVALADIFTGRAVTSSTWTQLARLAGWVRSRGLCLIAGHRPHISITSSHTARYRCRPSGVAIARLYFLTVTSTGATGGSALVSINGGATQRVVASPNYLSTTTIVESVAKSSAEAEITIAFSSVTGQLSVTSISCYELPRAALSADATDLGIHLDTTAPGDAIVATSYESVAGVAELSRSLTTRRGTLVSAWFHEPAVFGAGPTDLFVTPIKIVPSIDRASDTTRSVAWAVYAKVTSGTFTVYVEDSAAASTSRVISSTSLAWSTTQTKAFKCEDIASTIDGLRGGSADTVRVIVQRTTGTGQLELHGLGVWEQP